MIGPSSGSNWQLCVTNIYLYMLGTTTTLSMLFQVLELWLCVHLKEKILFLGLAVTEIVYRARPILSLAKSWGLRPALITQNTPKRVSKLHALNDEKCLKASWLCLSIITAQGYKLCIQSVVRLGLPLL